MKTRSRFALVPGAPRTVVRLAVIGVAALAAVGLGGCESPPDAGAVASHAAPPQDPHALAADLNARLEALQRQSEPASDDVISSLERTLREEREKRARAVIAAGSTAVIPAAAASPPVPAKPVAAAAPAVVATTAAPGKPAHLTKAQARAAAARAAAAAKQAPAPAPGVPAPARSAGLASNAAALPPMHPPETLPPPAMVRTTAATVAGPVRTPMSRTPESRLPVDELYARARALEQQSQTVQAIGLYREASQRGHAPSSQRLMELYADGAPGVARDYRVAVFFKERAVQQGVSFEPIWRR